MYYISGMKFSKEYQPKHYTAEERKIVVSVRIKPSTKQWLKDHHRKGGDIIEEYVIKNK